MRYPKNVNIYLMLKGHKGDIPTADIMVDAMDDVFDRCGVLEEEKEELGDILFRIQEVAEMVGGLGFDVVYDIDALPESMRRPIEIYNAWTKELNRSENK